MALSIVDAVEANPCFTCNSHTAEALQNNIKINAIKLDSRYTTNQQIYKLVSTYSISKINIKLNDIKKTKMIQTICIYYNNRSVQSVIELKNKPNMWLKAKQVKLQPSQNDIRIDFSLPIVASNVMFEYVEFYENQSQLTVEQLQCPRCSATVNAHPGVCNNCGENVFQCHKCRAINYDERDPFLCNACGFCKFAKFDMTIVGKQCCDIEIIENEEDHRKCLATINGLLDKSDRLYRNLIDCMKPSLETLLIKLVGEQSVYERQHHCDDAPAPSSSCMCLFLVILSLSVLIVLIVVCLKHNNTTAAQQQQPMRMQWLHQRRLLANVHNHHKQPQATMQTWDNKRRPRR